ncbi:unnamed protein product [marine sediment metagenome]|uniref:Uncharacterized protein n=1 Tax=marine sediment metagenome TaxID=412755 RepID=X1FE36_9ZZZZ
MPSVNDDDCEKRRDKIYKMLHDKLNGKTFWALLVIIVAITVASMGAIGNYALAHSQKSAMHVDPDSPPVGQREFKMFTKNQETTNGELKRDIKEISKTQTAILVEIRKMNGHE